MFHLSLFHTWLHCNIAFITISSMQIIQILNINITTFKDTLWVLRRDEPLVHVSVDISLITKHILDHDTSLKAEICGYLLLSVV